MNDVREWQEENLTLVVKANEKENVSLDYKASEALNFGDKTPIADSKKTLGQKHREDLIRDVAAMANAEGGMIIYGIEERTGGFPKRVDDGIDPNKTSADKIEQILGSNFHPRLEGSFIRQIELKSKGQGRSAFVIVIPKASTKAPHQSDDKLYYKRHDATKLAMDDNEIRDMVRRSIEYGKKFGIAWELLIEIRRLIASASERSKISHGHYMPRSSLQIGVSNGLRTAGVAIMSLTRGLRQSAARLVNAMDEYNSIIEVIDPGRGNEARLNEPMRALLAEIMTLGDGICGGLLQVLKDEP